MSSGTIRLHFDQMTTEELLDIWTANNRNEYADETFKVISDILRERGVVVPPQKEFSIDTHDNDDFSVGKFFGFELLISSSLIKILYIIGMIITTISGFIMMNSNTLAGISMLIFGNLFWRIVCEGFIIFFRVHDLLVSINKNLTRKG